MECSTKWGRADEGRQALHAHRPSQGLGRGLFLFPARLFNRDLAALALTFRNRHGDFQHAIIELGVHLVGIDGFHRQWNAPPKASVAPFGPVKIGPLFFMFPLAFALEDQSVVGDLYLHILFVDTGKLCTNDELTVSLE